ncbi:YhgE/Pip family protein [Cellulomonas iranensis]|uniref:YhgE/Pip family protein n=1 Tax=Cellulomonas iranensis TaxID=76862 RepID=UPI003D7E39F9
MSVLSTGTELRRFRRGTLPKIALAVLFVIPLIYGALYLWAFWAPTDHLDRLPVALVDQDVAVTRTDGTELHAGADVTQRLLDGGDLGWRLVDAKTAADGVADGSYYFSVTIPAGFSASLATLSEDDPQPGTIDVVYDDANSFLADTLGKTAMVRVRDAVAESVTRDAADTMLVGVSTLADGVRDAADAATRLDDGAQQLNGGAGALVVGLGQLADGSARLGDGTAQVSSGTAQLASGLQTAHDGAGRLVDGSGALADGLASADAGAQKLSGGAGTLSTGLGDLATGAHDAATGAATLDGGLQRLAPGATTLRDGLASLDEKAKALPASATALADGATRVAGGVTALQQLRTANPDMTLAQLDAVLQSKGSSIDALAAGAGAVSTGAGQLSASATPLASGVSQLHAGADRLASGLGDAATGATTLHTGLARLDQGAASAASGARDLATGAQSLATGVAQLDTGAHTLADGTQTLASGLGTAAGKAGQLADGAAQVADGAATLRTGASTAAAGSTTLADGTRTLAEGAGTFASTLQDGAAKAPSFTPDRVERTADAVATPVMLDETTHHEVQGFGEGFAPFFIALATFVGALITWLILRPLPRRPLASGVSGLRTVLTGYLPAAAVGVVQVVVMMFVLVLGIGMQPVHLIGMAAFILLTTLAFLALQQMFVVLLGTAAGRVVALVLLMLQLSSSGGTYPVETTPRFFQALHPYMPATYVVDGLRELVGGGVDQRLWAAVLVMSALLIGSLAVSAWSARRQKVWTIARLHPELSV